MNFAQTLQAVGEFVDLGLTIAGAAAAIATVVPAPAKTRKVLGTAHKVLQILACNFGKAKNRGDQ